jgi:hypothetical protein
MRDLYSLLNLSRRASNKDIKAAYWMLAKRFHPDLNAGDKEAEGWTKEINRAYEILGNPDARAAYDLEMARQRSKARRSFLRGAVVGAATIVLTAASISIALVWKQHTLQTGSAKNDMLVSNAPAHQHDTPRSTVSEHPQLATDPAVPVSAPLPKVSTELPALTSSEVTSTAPTDRAVPTLDAPSSVVTAHASKEGQASAAPSEPSKMEMPEERPVAPDRQPRPRTELAIVAPPQNDAKQPASPATVDHEPSVKVLPRDANRKVEAVGSVHKTPNKHLNMPPVAGTAPTKLQRSEREPRLVSSRATALRWPSADEPFVNLGVRNR